MVISTPSFELEVTAQEKRAVTKLLTQRGSNLLQLIQQANSAREEQVGNIVTFIRNQNLNFTNICYKGCRFCGFGVSKNHPSAYYMSLDEIRDHVLQAKQREVTEITLTGGINPLASFQTYIDIIKTIKKTAPNIHIHAYSPFEVKIMSELAGISVENVFSELKKAGLGSLCGTAAEILVDDVRKIICPNKLTTGEWIEIIMLAHAKGIPSTSTIMYGHVEQPQHIAEHLLILKKIQETTNGFTEFIPLPFIHHNTPLYKKGLARPGSTGMEDLALLATSRILFGKLIPNIQVSWVKTGLKFAQFGLLAGANDVGGTLFEEKISKSAGASHGTFQSEETLIRIIKDAKRKPARRDTLYNIIQYY